MNEVWPQSGPSVRSRFQGESASNFFRAEVLHPGIILGVVIWQSGIVSAVSTIDGVPGSYPAT